MHRVPVDLARTSPGGLVDGRYLLEMRSERGSLNFLDFVAEELRQDELLVDRSFYGRPHVPEQRFVAKAEQDCR